ncbi:MAG: VanW family protein [Eubacteriales bacterium]
MKKCAAVCAFCAFIILSACSFSAPLRAAAMPFYGLDPQPLVLRAEFTTDYSKSAADRKHNIALAAKSLNDALVAPGEEFSFNRRVGERTKARGYKEAKIIVGGEFVEGVGGGVCQVSTTLYNAALLAGLWITECHPHSLQVSYVKPSFDAMVSYYTADLKFVNDTKNPMYLKTIADGNKLTVRIYGEKLKGRVVLESRVVETFAPEETLIVDEKGEFPELKKGERLVVGYGKAGVKSEGYALFFAENGTLLSKKKIRKDRYNSIARIVVEGTAEPDPPVGAEEETPSALRYSISMLKLRGTS